MTQGAYGHMSLPREQLRQALGVDRPRMELQEEVESLRSQVANNEAIIDQLEQEAKQRIRAWHSMEQRAVNAEQERDKYKIRLKVRDEMAKRYFEANTAMREALEFYADEETYDIAHLDKHGYIIIDFDGGAKAQHVLSRYPKEGGPEDATI